MTGSLGRAFRAFFGGDDAERKPKTEKPASKTAGTTPNKGGTGKAGATKPMGKKKAAAKSAKRPAAPAPVPASALHDDIENVELALAIARAEAILDEPKRLPAGDSPLKTDLTRALENEAARGGSAGAKAAALLEQIDAGTAQIPREEAPAAESSEPLTVSDEPMDREALIRQALAIQREKAKMIHRLPREARERLVIMAQHAFGGPGPKG